jgi:formylglycine-generating enzyme required for sulfatase activity
LADLAKINPKEERKLEAKHLIRRHALDLEWNNPELRTKAIGELTAYAQELKAIHQSEPSWQASEGLPDMAIAVRPLELTLAEPSFAVADRAATAEALGHIGGPRVAEALERMINNDQGPSVAVRRAAAEALGLVDASSDDPQAHWELLEGILADTANHLDRETNQAVIDAKLPLLQGASRGLQRLAGRRLPPRWGLNKQIVPMLSLQTSAGAITTRVLEIPVWQVPLPGELPLELVAVPEGSYRIGSPKEEVGRVEGCGHLAQVRDATLVEADRTVRLSSAFLLARYPLTQAQWLSLADEKRLVARRLDPDPAQRKGLDLPVEFVGWDDANEWCARLENFLQEMLPELSLEVRLPSESEWEVACRAGSCCPFHFGDTLDPTWANYDGRHVYPPGQSGAFLNRTSPVGAYGLVNSLGLADLHGNVWEWCADRWHRYPLHAEGWPADGRAWIVPDVGLEGDGQQQWRLLRGGSWFSGPHDCRAAFRFSGFPPADVRTNVGFRPGCFSPPGSLFGT